VVLLLRLVRELASQKGVQPATRELVFVVQGRPARRQGSWTWGLSDMCLLRQFVICWETWLVLYRRNVGTWALIRMSSVQAGAFEVGLYCDFARLTGEQRLSVAVGVPCVLWHGALQMLLSHLFSLSQPLNMSNAPRTTKILGKSRKNRESVACVWSSEAHELPKRPVPALLRSWNAHNASANRVGRAFRKLGLSF
jgi:hypothetical protein